MNDRSVEDLCCHALNARHSAGLRNTEVQFFDSVFLVCGNAASETQRDVGEGADQG